MSDQEQQSEGSQSTQDKDFVGPPRPPAEEPAKSSETVPEAAESAESADLVPEAAEAAESADAVPEPGENVVPLVSPLSAELGYGAFEPTKHEVFVKKQAKNAVQGMGLFIAAKHEDASGGYYVLSDGMSCLNQTALSVLCGVAQPVLSRLFSDWGDRNSTRYRALCASLKRQKQTPPPAPRIVVRDKGRDHSMYPRPICMALLEYYTLDAPERYRTATARENFTRLGGAAFDTTIYGVTGYKPPTPSDILRPYTERLAYNQSDVVPPRFFCVFHALANAMHAMCYSSLPPGEKVILDISVGLLWSKVYEEKYEKKYGKSKLYRHTYPPSYPQAKAGPVWAKCYPRAALPAFLDWLDDEYMLGKGLFNYLRGQEKKGKLPADIGAEALRAEFVANMGLLASPSGKKKQLR